MAEDPGYYEVDGAGYPVLLEEFGGCRPGDTVVYENPAMRNEDGTYRTAGMDGPLTVDAIYDFGDGFVQAVLNGGDWECSAANLRKVAGEDGG
jgi:hypothetical protein